MYGLACEAKGAGIGTRPDVVADEIHTYVASVRALPPHCEPGNECEHCRPEAVLYAVELEPGRWMDDFDGGAATWTDRESAEAIVKEFRTNHAPHARVVALCRLPEPA